MSKMTIRQARPGDMDAIAALNTGAFGSPAEAGIVRQLAADGDSLLSLVAEDAGTIVGHIQFFPVRVDGRDIAAGLGPMSVTPDRQRSGIGRKLIMAGMPLMEQAGRSLVFVLGHTDYYPHFGFSPEVAARYSAPWSGPAFMGIELSMNAPRSGTLTYPKAFTDAA